jgi:hypothetical protein
MIDPFNGFPCVVGKIYGVLGMTFHGNIIAPGDYIMAVTTIERRPAKLPFSNPNATKVDDMGNGIVLWREKDLIAIL